MNDKFDNQKETLVSLSHEINLLQQQVKYLLRNEKAAELLDLDVLMNRTHTIYDMICTIGVNDNDEEQDFDIDPEALTALFGGIVEDEEVESGELENEELENEEVESGEDAAASRLCEEEGRSNPEEESGEVDSGKVESGKFVETPIHRVSEEETEEIHETEEEPIAEEQPEPQQEGDDFGLFFRFEDIPVKEVESEKVESGEVESEEVESEKVESGEVESEEVESEEVESEEIKDDVVEEIDGKTVHFMEEVTIDEIPEKDRIDGENLIPDDPFKMPAMEDENISPEPIEQTDEESTTESEKLVEQPESNIEQPSTSPYGNIFEKDDMGFEMSTNETLGERMMGDDNSLAARYQQAPVNDLKSAIGLNDKFLFVNELFGGSMEKYNKSIDNLNDLKTLNGAMIYLNELKVELQWNSSNEAYKKLWALVAQKFEAQ